MKTRIFRSAEDQTGAGTADPTDAVRMGGQVLPAAVSEASETAGDADRIEAAAESSRQADQTVVATPPTGPIKIAARDVSVFYEGKQALFEVSLDIPDKTVTALIGPSGCGKSTFLRTMNRMNDTISGAKVTGRIAMDGEDINDRSIDPVLLRARVGMVFQRPNPFPKSIYENVAYGPKIHGLVSAKSEMDGVVESAVNPEVILMDEPCSALDPIATARIEELIDELRERFCIVIVTHSMAQAARVSQRTAFFHMGRLVETGDTEDIFQNPRERRTLDYITGRFG